jgi:hypothetical protein
MNVEKLLEETNNIRKIDINKLSPEQMEQLVERLSAIMTATEQQISEIKIETNEG